MVDETYQKVSAFLFYFFGNKKVNRLVTLRYKVTPKELREKRSLSLASIKT